MEQEVQSEIGSGLPSQIINLRSTQASQNHPAQATIGAKTKRRRVALYARVSTNDQDCAMQLRELRAYCASRGFHATAEDEYVDTGWSGAKWNRPQFDRLMSGARKRRFDTVIVWKLDRWGRSIGHLIETINELRQLGVRWIAVTQNLDTGEDSPTSRLLLHVMASFAEFEREMIRERVTAGLRAAKEKGTRSGLPVGRPKTIFDRAAVINLRNSGASWRTIALRFNVGITTVRRAYSEAPRPEASRTEAA